ncbi:MAG: iron-containing alcohol dehydrogenase [Alicyclobacillaceae bacterium]|nr:iron-containing alcohol dehydrogenase [Alicyclobacillaceae bacterium]
MIPFSLHIPTKIYFGPGRVEEVGDIVKQYAGRVLLVTGRTSAKKTGVLDRVADRLREAGVEFVLFDKIEPNPRTSTVDEGGRIAREEGCQLVLALGGGSAMDAAKAIATVALSGLPIYEYMSGNRTGRWKELLPIQEALPVITVPTLAATGSESNSTAVITNWETKEKSGIRGPALFPKAAILDPELTYTVPANYTADGAVDMFTHLYEGYLTGDEHAHVQDELTEGLMRNVVRFARKAIERPDHEEARAHLLWTSTLALNGITNAGRGGSYPVHQMEHTVSAYYDISHGRGLAILAPAYFRLIVLEDRPRRLARLGRQVFQVTAGDDRRAAEATIEAFEAWLREIGAFDTLKGVGVRREDLRMMAEETIRVGGKGEKYLAGTRPIGVEEVLRVYEAAYE